MKYTIEQARILGGYKQVQMAERLGMSEKTYIQYEKYRKVFRYDHAYNFSKIVKIPIDQVIFFEGQVQKNCS
jgi:DNA-binding XRE family transcriptional regulator